MNCTKCGKEIPDGENKLCDDCQKALVAEIANEEKVEKVEKETKSTKKSTRGKDKEKSLEKTKKDNKPKNAKKETKKETKSDDENKKVSKKMAIVLAVVAVLVVLAIVVVLCFFKPNSKVGNTIGNIRNYGYAVAEGSWIYYLSPNEDYSQLGIYKVKRDGVSSKSQIYTENIDIVSLNYWNDYLYFIGIGNEQYSETDDTDNKIYRIKTDGTDLQILNDNEFNNECYEIYVVNNKIYYIGEDANIYTMNLDGSNKNVLVENGTGYLGVSENYIILNTENTDGTDYVTEIMTINGEDKKPIIENKRLYSVNITGDYVYYTNSDKQICRTLIGSGEEQIIFETEAYNLNTSGDYAYYLNYKDAANEDYTVCVNRVKLDGSSENVECIKEMDTYSSFLDVVDNWVLYMDSNETSGFLNLVKKDGSETKQLYLLDYGTYIADNQDAVQTTVTEQQSEETPVVESPTETSVETTDETPNAQ